MGGNQYYLTTHSSVQKMHSSLIGPLWADAICINQEDPDERNHQVKFMGDIFRRASLVLGYVCEPSQGVRVATEVIKTVCEAVARAESESVENWEELCPSLWETSNNHQIFNSVWKNVIYLSRMPYWTRLWILQEVVLGREVTFIIGMTFISFENLMTFCFCFEMGEVSARPALRHIAKTGYLQGEVVSARMRKGRISGFLGFHLLHRVAYLLRAYQTHTPQLLSVVDMASLLQATDPRDKLYAILGMTSSSVLPDYTKSVQEVYTEFASAYVIGCGVRLVTETKFSILQLSGTSLWATSYNRGPSWVPYWPALDLAGYYWIGNLSGVSQGFLTGKNTPPIDVCIEESDTLHFTAVTVDCIDYLAPPHDLDATRAKSVLEYTCQLLCKAGPEETNVPEHEFENLVICLVLGIDSEHQDHLKDDEVQIIGEAVVKLLLDIVAKQPDVQIPDWVRGRSQGLLKDATVQMPDQTR